MSKSIRIVFATQYLENYGAHDWDGEGECPQYWKPKGGSTYIVACTPEELADAEWYDAVESGIARRNDYEQEYVIDVKVVDEVDFVESDYVDFYEAAIYVHVSIGGDLVMQQEVLNFQNQVVGQRTWVQNGVEGMIGDGSYEKFEPVTVPWRQKAEGAMYGECA